MDAKQFDFYSTRIQVYSSILRLINFRRILLIAFMFDNKLLRKTEILHCNIVFAGSVFSQTRLKAAEMNPPVHAPSNHQINKHKLLANLLF